MIIEKEFKYDTEYVELKGTVTLDISEEIPVVKDVQFEDSPLDTLKDVVEELICEDENFNTRKLRLEEKQWEECEEADAKRKEID
tara:strand:+ start:1056 stop:1310 length:255 start_codon:yes stop_codon:yes gene_type:complete